MRIAGILSRNQPTVESKRDAAAISYAINLHFTIGAEALHEIDIPNWDKAKKSVLWTGPNASIRFGHWYVAVTPLVRLSDNREEPHVQTRLITGFEF